MPTHEGETTLGRYQREREVELARYAKMTPEEIERLVIDKHNLEAEKQGLVAALIEIRDGYGLVDSHPRGPQMYSSVGRIANKAILEVLL